MNGFTVLIPAHDAAAVMRATLERVHAHLVTLGGAYRTEVIVVDDASHDATAAIVETFRRERTGWLQLVRHPKRRGYRESLRTGLAAARLPNVVVADAQLSFPAETVGALADALFRTGADCAVASPLIPGGRIEGVPLHRALGFRLANRTLARAGGGRIQTVTADFRAYDAAVLRDLLAGESEGEFNSWAIARLAILKRMVVEVPALMRGGSYRRPSLGDVVELWSRVAALRRSARVLRRARPALRAPGIATQVKIGTFGPN
ncbi:MAG: glycosyltransferase family 2 protein [Candidatus Eremiobacteraeota bacterium]|nr:glycosyltransferase family 2 protein [Candidatus Eremiobacteraeota bacterium]